MKTTAEILPVSRGPHRLYVEATAGEGAPVVLMHGFPDNTHLYDRLVPFLAGCRPVVRFDFLGWGRSDKPEGYPYTASNQVGDVAAVAKAAREHFGASQLVLVAHDASGPPAIDWALANPGQIETLVLLNTYYQWTPALRRPPAIALYSTPLIRNAARAAVMRRPDLDRRLYAWQVGKFIKDPAARAQLVTELYEQFLPARPAFWRLNDDLMTAVLARRFRVRQMRRFRPPVVVIFGASDRYLNPSVGARFAALFPNAEMHLLSGAGHYVQVDQPQRVAELMLA
jgi:pimeloyl-ACP methyl ester carboxylesterase